MFDPESFMQTAVEGDFDTKRQLIPAGEYQAVLDTIEPKTVGDDNKPILNCRLKLINTGDEDLDGRVVFHTIWLDVNDNGALDRGAGKNIGLGQLLEALNLNGKQWSPAELAGQPVQIILGHRFDKRNDEMRENVSKFAAL